MKEIFTNVRGWFSDVVAPIGEEVRILCESLLYETNQLYLKTGDKLRYVVVVEIEDPQRSISEIGHGEMAVSVSQTHDGERYGVHFHGVGNPFSKKPTCVVLYDALRKCKISLILRGDELECAYIGMDLAYRHTIVRPDDEVVDLQVPLDVPMKVRRIRHDRYRVFRD